MSRTLIQGSQVITLDDQGGPAAIADILIVDGRIEQIGPDLDVADAEVIDGTGTIAVPGFVDTHRHTWESIIRGMLSSGTLGDYYMQVQIGVGPVVRAEDIYAGNLIGAYEALNAGVTTVVDWFNAANTPEHVDAAVTGLQETHIRSMFAYGPPSLPEYLGPGAPGHPVDAKRVKDQYFSSGDQLLTFALGLRGPIGPDPETNRQDFALARELGARITEHAGMRLPGLPNGEVRLLQADGLLGPDLTIVHANETDDEELRMLVDAGSTVSVAPYVELVMGHGRPPTNRVRAAGLAPSLSMDCACTAPGDMFTQMHTVLAHSHGEQLPASPGDGYFTPDLTAHEVLRFATVNGALACGLEDRIGTLTVGKAADIVLIRSDAINTMPNLDPVATVVTQADVSNVDTVLVAGRVVKRDGKLVDVDLPRLRQLGQAASEYVVAAAARAAADRPPAG